MAGKIRTAQYDDVLKVLRESMDQVGPIVEEFDVIPRANATNDATANTNYIVSGTNATAATAAVHHVDGGLTLVTAGADNDQVIISPRTTAQRGLVNAINLNTRNQPYVGAKIVTTASVADLRIHVGFSLTAAVDETTDADFAKFTYTGDDGHLHAATRADGGTAGRRNLFVPVEASSAYELAVRVDAERRPRFYVNGREEYMGAPLKDNVNLIPVVAIQALAAAAKTIRLRKIVVGRAHSE